MSRVVTTASAFSYDSSKMRSKLRESVSVRTKLPLTIATPRTIATAVSVARSFRPSSPRMATCRIPDPLMAPRVLPAFAPPAGA